MKNRTLNGAAILCLLICFDRSFVMAGQEAHGGDVVVKDGTVRFLDLTEGAPDFYIPSKESYYGQAVSLRLLSLSRKIGISAVYPHQMDWIFTNTKLENIEDEGVIFTALDGTLMQVAAQKNNVVLLNKPLFYQLSETDRAALMMHEALISAAIKDGRDLKSNVGTLPIRKIVAIMFSENGESVTFGYYRSIWNELPMLQKPRTPTNNHPPRKK